MRSSILVVLSATLLLCCGGGSDADFHSDWSQALDRPWPGADYWANPWQDWRLQDGRLENHVAGGDRNVFLLTREISSRPGAFETSVKLGRIGSEAIDEGFVGFRVGIRGAFDDYRDSAVRGYGLEAGVAADGRLFIGKLEQGAPQVELAELTLTLSAEPAGDAYTLTLTAGETSHTRTDVPAEWLVGGLALVSSSAPLQETPMPVEEVRETGWQGKSGTQRGGTTTFWFSDWTVSGDKIDSFPERAFGPILFAMHTLSGGRLELTAQLAPVGPDAPREAALEIQVGEDWQEVARTTIEPKARIAMFSVEAWDDSQDTPYRVRYQDDYYEGTIRKDPVDKDEIVVAAFTGNNDLGFPHADIVRSVQHHRPDLLAFTGDNIYERVGEYGIQRDPVGAAILDYLRKWTLFGWEYSELLKDTPAVAIPDDHDVYQGNIWGAGGRHATEYGKPGQDQGGFTMDRDFVEVVHLTQTSNLPAPYDPTPVEQGIPVYYTDLRIGGVSFAVIEDRQWKSAPAVVLPDAEIVNGWAQNPRYDASKDGDVAGATLLGERQLEFLEDWAADWSDGVWMKSVISQTIFNNVATLPKGTTSDDVTPKLRVNPPGEYAPNEWPVQDHDSNAWPQTGRNKAVRKMRQAMAFHIAGDQHLGSTIQYGIDDFGDAGWAICVPSVANIWPRRWFPPQPGANHQDGMPKYTGDYLDGFGNKMTVVAVSNPEANQIEPTAINHRAPGYGIIKFNRDDRKLSLANWPRWVDPSQAGAEPYPGWPVEIDQLDNGWSGADWQLEPVTAEVDDPVIQVLEVDTGAIQYTLRIDGREHTPRVWKAGRYSVRVDGETVWTGAAKRR